MYISDLHLGRVSDRYLWNILIGILSLVMAVPVWGQETYRAVDLGLSVCWAAQNVGATSPTLIMGSVPMIFGP